MSPNTPSPHTSRNSGYMAVQNKALDAIGDALKQRWIDFYIATKLRDLVKLGRVDEAERILQRFE